jgi:hypothetical protein
VVNFSSKWGFFKQKLGFPGLTKLGKGNVGILITCRQIKNSQPAPEIGLKTQIEDFATKKNLAKSSESLKPHQVAALKVRLFMLGCLR